MGDRQEVKNITFVEKAVETRGFPCDIGYPLYVTSGTLLHDFHVTSGTP
jgi:hypothetical protein